MTIRDKQLKNLVRKKPGVQMHAGPGDGDLSTITQKRDNDQIDQYPAMTGWGTDCKPTSHQDECLG
ncbi:MAG: hypothetical protein CMP86_12920 [Gammaproteobacteria bacterium]|nr:hypothetical protein [Gammaproteobacteria bacterium]